MSLLTVQVGTEAEHQVQLLELHLVQELVDTAVVRVIAAWQG